MRLIRAVLSEEGAFLGAPPPNGRPGGYPIIVSSEGVQLAPIKNLPLAEAIAINEQSHRFDGIEYIEEDGTTVFRSEATDILRSTLGYVCDRLPPSETEERANELISRFRTYAERLGVDLGRFGLSPDQG
jgi:hypothetical protein